MDSVSTSTVLFIFIYFLAFDFQLHEIGFNYSFTLCM